MARVKNPLNSLAASGSVGELVTYQHRHTDSPIEVRRSINGEPVTAIYPERIIDGRGIARLKPRSRGDLSRRRLAARGARGKAAIESQDRFNLARILADWCVRNNIAIFGPTAVPRPPFWSGVYDQRGENREMRKFPGQPAGESVSIRRRITGTITPRGYMMRQLLSRRLIRYNITLAAFLNLDNAARSTWTPSPAAPTDPLPIPYQVGDLTIRDPAFYHFWIIAAFFINRFDMPQFWVQNGERARVVSGFQVAPIPPEKIEAWENHIAAQNEIRRQTTGPW